MDSASFFNFPRPLKREAYSFAQEEFVNRVSRFDGVLSIVRFGSVGFPGLSDLDLIVVLDDDADAVPTSINHISRYSEDTRYVLFHPQFVVPRKLISELRWLVPIFELEPLYGADVTFRRPLPHDETVLDLGFMLQSVLTDLSWVFRGMRSKSSYDVRMAQAKLNLLGKNLELAHKQECDFSATEFPFLVRQLREEWFELPETILCKRLQELLEFGHEELARLCTWLSKHSAGTYASNADSFFTHHYEDIKTEFSVNDSRRFTLHPSLLALFQPAIAHHGRIADWLRHTVVPSSLPTHPGLLETIAQRVRLAEAHIAWIEQRGLDSGIFNYFGYQVGYRSGPRSKLRLASWVVGEAIRRRRAR
jgi:hypothetical protein